MTQFLKASSTISPDPGLQSRRDRAHLSIKASKKEDMSVLGSCSLTLLLFPCRLLLSCSTHSPDLWPWHTPRSWDKDCSLQPGLEPETGGCPPERDPVDTQQAHVCVKESCLYEGTTACECSTWCNKMLFMGSCDWNRAISCSKVVFWSTTATRWSSPRSAHPKYKNVAKVSYLFFPIQPHSLPVPRCNSAPLRPVCVTASLVYVIPFRTSRGAAETLLSIRGWSLTNVNTLSGSLREVSNPLAFRSLFKHYSIWRE